MDRSRFTLFAWGVLGYNLLVVLWGAVVRATVSGDGCGKHWPFCDGQVVPTFHRTQTVIEFGHRFSTGLVLVLLLPLVFYAFRLFPDRHPVRLGAKLALLFTMTEALLGAGLVLFGLVAHNDSVNRAIVMGLHLVNTLALLGALTLTAWWSAGGPAIMLRGQGAVGMMLGVALLGALVLALSGSVTALVDTLYPAQSLEAALHQDLYPGVHVLIRLRLLHPIIAIIVCLYTVTVAGAVNRLRPSPDMARFAGTVVLLFGIEIAAGFMNLLLLAPVWMQVVHLLLADLLWINLLLLAASALAKRYSFSEKF
jgi:heme A synthase